MFLLDDTSVLSLGHDKTFRSDDEAGTLGNVKSLFH